MLRLNLHLIWKKVLAVVQTLLKKKLEKNLISKTSTRTLNYSISMIWLWNATLVALSRTTKPSWIKTKAAKTVSLSLLKIHFAKILNQNWQWKGSNQSVKHSIVASWQTWWMIHLVILTKHLNLKDQAYLTSLTKVMSWRDCKTNLENP
jgi:hypothetical protein